jgi:hypothetical protein
MNEALAGVLLQPDSWSSTASHVQFLLFFAALMMAAGWMSYWKMVQAERRL